MGKTVKIVTKRLQSGYKTVTKSMFFEKISKSIMKMSVNILTE